MCSQRELICLHNSVSFTSFKKAREALTFSSQFFTQELNVSWLRENKQGIFCLFFCDRALDILEEINLSVSRKNKFSEAAYNKLLNNNLSLKYSQTGYLSSSNIISDGFYDYGRVSDSTCLCFTMISPFILIHFHRQKCENQHFSLDSWL